MDAFFFFQAEDGIRDTAVTGVQTCALPISLISAPTSDKPFGRSFTVSRLGNVVEDGGVRYLNLTPARLKELAVSQLKDGLPVWFGCDVAQSYLRDEGIMDTAALDVDGLLGFPVEGALDKAERLDFGESLMTHAMVLEGVRLDDAGRPVLWKVENSWGKDHGRDGFDTLSDAWFDEYVYQVVVDRAYLTDEERAGDEAPLCALDRVFDKASAFMMRGPSYSVDRKSVGRERV